MKRPRLLVVSEPMEYGVLSYLERLFGGLDRTRWEPALAFSPGRMAPQARRLVTSLAAAGVRVRRLAFRRGLGARDLVAGAQLLAELRAFRPDIVHLHSTKAGLIGRAVARLAGVGVLYTPHGTSWHYTGRVTGRVQLALERALRGSTDVLLSVCPEEAGAFVREVGFDERRVRVVRNAVSLPEEAVRAAARARGRAALGIPDEAVWAVFLGRLTPEKGLDVLLGALTSDVGLDGLLVVGDGPARAQLEAVAARATVPVRFCGYREEGSELLAAGDLFVQPSRSEGLPFALLEAMAHALPVVASDVGGVRSALGDGGRLVPAGEPAALAVAIREVATDPALRQTLGAVAQTRVRREFGVAAMLGGLHEAYEAACEARWRSRPVGLSVA
jgi:glycosyltransferase involved in cell wall biosynthesis